jgi:predicted nucleic acid-binding protein
LGLSRIFFDTNIFIYLFEDEGARGAAVAELIERMQERSDTLLTSTLTLGEMMVKPIESGDLSLAKRYEEVLKGPGISLVPFDLAAAAAYARIRATGSVRPPDAIQLACAASVGCDLFVTNDLSLSKKTVPGIQFITSLERVPL